MTRFGDGLATGLDLAAAAEEAVRQATRSLDGRADLLCVFVSGSDPAEIERAARHAMAVTDARTVLGCSAHGVIGGGRGVERGQKDTDDVGAVAAWAAILPGARLTPFELETLRAEDRLVVVGMPEAAPDDVVGILLADPHSFPVDAFVERSEEVLPGLPLVGGLAGGGEGESRLFVDDKIIESGAVGVVIGGQVAATTLLSQGARPIGPLMTVTSAEQNILFELAGSPALDKLEEVVAGLTGSERELAAEGLLIGVAMDEYADEHEQGDFLVRGVVGVDPDTGALAVGDVVETGQTVRFQVRDAGAADSNLDQLVRGFDVGPVEGALLFSCNGRGKAMFGGSDHDIRALDGFGSVGGFFADGEIGPVAGRNHVHGFTASILAFGARDARQTGRTAHGR
ncbi:FIST N-terminal domain-containing protein [Actinocorallia sp. A-T 12471]|uniref:FIST signal transduction protein n=1 Tax=Actinocorallia sp. A-T 12471 TaxID=3089813 RepID=UPI0029D0784F|nr:FIST N-terminal domain-containing protein [Actinocorallia sp. A-T 12471]MDX6738554.1 FIST N-terminal domain-containing protein [Actinocorallia sp. A-T 12471]